MYQIKCDDWILLDGRTQELSMSSAKLNLECNTAGSLSFTILKNHPFYNKIQKLKSIITVLENNTVIFKGRQNYDSLNWFNSKTVTVEGVTAYLNDSIIDPYSFPDDVSDDENYINSDNVVEYFLNWAITKHNAQVTEQQKFILGTVTVTDPNNYISRSNSDYSTTWEVIKNKLIDDLGGYLCVRYEDDGNYLDYYSELPLTNTQTIEFGGNMLDLTNENNLTETCSAVLPVGSDGLTIEEIDDGELTDDLIKSGKVIYSLSAVENYGYICKTLSYSDVTIQENLLTKAKNWLSETGYKFNNSVTVSAVDLNCTDTQIQSFRVGRKVNVTSSPHNFNDIFDLNKLEIDLLNPQNTIITLGATNLSLITDNQSAETKLNDKFENASSEIKATVLSAVDKETQTNMTSILANCQNIITEATSDYVKTGNFESYQETVSTQFTQTAEEIELNFKTLVEQIQDVNGDLQEQYNERYKYIRFVDGNIILGQEGNEVTCKIENNKISFVQNGQDVAYFKNNKLYVTSGEFTNVLQIGNFQLIAQSSGNLSLKKAGA